MALKCVPLNPVWTGDTKLDLRGIYRRPNGDLTSALPLRRHAQWVAKGFEYVTLADAESFEIAARHLRAEGKNPQDYVAGYDPGSGKPTPWSAEAYLEGDAARKASDEAELVAMIAEFGVETVERIKGVTVPERLRPTDETTETTTNGVKKRGRPAKAEAVQA